ncbi:hypothetical protein DFH06DRAFT_1137527 [Mycena polygramma]|nr:hypothetical protein DFH06DRAFT_1137527 [Mycena polygramma]
MYEFVICDYGTFGTIRSGTGEIEFNASPPSCCCLYGLELCQSPTMVRIAFSASESFTEPALQFLTGTGTPRSTPPHAQLSGFAAVPSRARRQDESGRGELDSSILRGAGLPLERDVGMKRYVLRAPLRCQQSFDRRRRVQVVKGYSTRRRLSGGREKEHRRIGEGHGIASLRFSSVAAYCPFALVITPSILCCSLLFSLVVAHEGGPIRPHTPASRKDTSAARTPGRRWADSATRLKEALSTQLRCTPPPRCLSSVYTPSNTSAPFTPSDSSVGASPDFQRDVYNEHLHYKTAPMRLSSHLAARERHPCACTTPPISQPHLQNDSRTSYIPPLHYSANLHPPRARDHLRGSSRRKLGNELLLQARSDVLRSSQYHPRAPRFSLRRPRTPGISGPRYVHSFYITLPPLPSVCAPSAAGTCLSQPAPRAARRTRRPGVRLRYCAPSSSAATTGPCASKL